MRIWEAGGGPSSCRPAGFSPGFCSVSLDSIGLITLKLLYVLFYHLFLLFTSDHSACVN